jgi:hypothetical protein
MPRRNSRRGNTQCPFCGEYLYNSGQQFCQGHHIKYRNQLLRTIADESISTQTRADTERELARYGWTVTQPNRATRRANPTSARKFGIELEVAFANSTDFHNAQALIIAKGIELPDRGYTHQYKSTWKTVTDSTIRGGYTREFVSPPLPLNKESFKEIDKVLKGINAYDGEVNKSCGYHVHMDISDLSTAQVLNLLRLYKEFEDQIDEMHPGSRRGSQNTYCATMRTLDIPESINSIRSFAESVSSRYHKLNIKSYERHGTIEFRQHAGTTNSEKIRKWVEFCAAMVEFAKTQQPWSRYDSLYTLLNLSDTDQHYWTFRKAELRRAA